MRAVLLAVMASAGLVGCVGGIDMPNEPAPGQVGSGTNPSPVPPTMSMAKQMFDTNVYPIISKDMAATTSGCAGGACHNVAGATPTEFLAADAADGYATATSFQSLVGNFTAAEAGIITKIQPGPHNGRSYSAAEKQAITDWLAQEVVERNGGSGTGTGSGSGTLSPGQITANLLNGWSACMTEANWTTAGMTTAWGQMQTNNGSRCESCHSTGGQGFIATEIQDSGTSGPGMWTVVSTNEYYMVQFFTVDLTASPAKVVVNHVSFDGVSTATPPHTEHPTFNATTNNGMTALQKFYDLTTAAVTAGNCGAPKLNPPAQ